MVSGPKRIGDHHGHSNCSRRGTGHEGRAAREPPLSLRSRRRAPISSSGSKAGFSNYGATTVDIGAPGVGIHSTLPTRKNGSTYGSYSGTSMATPHVTGAAALYAAAHPGSTASQIRAAIMAAAVPTPSLAGKTVTGRRLDVGGF